VHKPPENIDLSNQYARINIWEEVIYTRIEKVNKAIWNFKSEKEMLGIHIVPELDSLLSQLEGVSDINELKISYYGARIQHEYSEYFSNNSLLELGNEGAVEDLLYDLKEHPLANQLGIEEEANNLFGINVQIIERINSIESELTNEKNRLNEN
jgi:hypothetical protein